MKVFYFSMKRIFFLGGFSDIYHCKTEMGINLELWRARVGCFSQPGPREKFKAPAIVVSRWLSRTLALSILLLAVSIHSGDPETGSLSLSLLKLHVFEVCSADCGFLDCGEIGYTGSDSLGESIHRGSWFTTGTLNLSGICTLRHTTVLMDMLLLSGDVESNPGPRGTTKEGGKSGGGRQTRLVSSQGAVGIDRDDLASELKDLCDRVDALEKENRQLKNAVDRLENQSRRNNLVFYGIDESDNETWEKCEESVRTVLADKFSVKAEEIEIERAHRLGRKRHPAPAADDDQARQGGVPGEKPRPVIIKLLNWKQKEEILQAARGKRDSQVKISEDFSLTVRNTRKRLIPHLLELRKKNPNKTVTLQFDKIKMGRRFFSIQDLEANGE